VFNRLYRAAEAAYFQVMVCIDERGWDVRAAVIRATGRGCWMESRKTNIAQNWDRQEARHASFSQFGALSRVMGLGYLASTPWDPVSAMDHGTSGDAATMPKGNPQKGSKLVPGSSTLAILGSN